MSEDTTATGPMSSERLAQFEQEVSTLKVTGGGANPERLGSQWGIALMVIAVGGSLFSWYSAYNSADLATQYRSIIMAIVFAIVGLIGAVVWLRNSMTRYLRFWLIRMVYEQREQTDRIVDASRR